MSYELEDFDYELPESLIAQRPVTPRDHSRLLVYDRESRTITDSHFYDLPNWLPRDTTLVANNSKVEKCRLLFDGGKREIFATRVIHPTMLEAMTRPGRHFRKGKKVALTDQLTAEVLDVSPDGLRTLELSHPLDDPIFDDVRSTPFPPYIRQDESLSERYQTVFARDSGSKAAPTAGLHFTPELIQSLKRQGVSWEEVTLHVGLGTFSPVKTDRIEDHVMHSEWYQIDADTAERLNRAPHITAVGTTSVRVLESAADRMGNLRGEVGETDIFIKPGDPFRRVQSLITNFHLPKSTLLMLVSAMTGLDEMHRIYRHAVRESYRFYSFGDAMLIR
ncbi:MAG: tRNA preQ1(34) S-adenosylmethionine ribosyltransferase-isomerase QueA [Balneolaceae bacterium]